MKTQFSRKLVGICLGMGLLSFHFTAHSAKPAPTSPVRAALINAIRHHPTLGPALAGSTLDIRRIWASDQYGFVCLLLVNKKDHQHQRDGDAYVVQQIVLLNKKMRAEENKDARAKGGEATWQAIAHIDGLSESSKRVQCASDPQGQITDAFLESIANNPSMALAPKADEAPASSPSSAATETATPAK